MTTFKKICILSMIIIPIFALSAKTETQSAQKNNPTQITANNPAELQPAQEKKSDAAQTPSVPEPAKDDNKTGYILGALAMIILMAIVMVKTKNLEK